MGKCPLIFEFCAKYQHIIQISVVIFEKKGFIYLVLGDRSLSKIKKEEQTPCGKRYSENFGEYQLCSFSHELFNPTDLSPPALTSGIICAEATLYTVYITQTYFLQNYPFNKPV